MILKLEKIVALIAINNTQPLRPNSTLIFISEKVLELLNYNLFILLACRGLIKNLVA